MRKPFMKKRLLTYPRTDSKYITSDMEGSTKELITGLCAALALYAGREAASRPCEDLRQQQSNRPSRHFADSGVCENGLFLPLPKVRKS